MAGIIHCEVAGNPALGFDTGLGAKAFAQTKSAQLITQPGWIVSADSTVELWKLEGVIEREGTMVIWGADFAGERLDNLISDSARKDAALDALRYWIQARIVLEETKEISLMPMPWPAGAFIDSQGTILFPPDQLIKRIIEAESSEVWRDSAERWVHPDLTGIEASVFAAGTISYRIFCGSSPFPNQDTDLLRQDLREGVFLPLKLAAPGLDNTLTALITGTIEAFTQNQQKNQQKKNAGKPPGVLLKTLADYLGSPGSATADSYFHSLSAEEQAKLSIEQERFRKKQNVTVKTKRFVIRNTAILTVILGAVIGIGLAVRGVIIERANRPTTKGMQPIEVAETYYTAIGSLDHTLMEACVIKKAGKNDIEMVINYFVISKTRQAYEMNAPGIISAQQWIDAGSPATEAAVFGVSDLKFQVLDADERDGEVSFRASYLFWHPQSEETDSNTEMNTEETVNRARNIPLTDTIRLILHKNAWRIAEIERKTM